MKAEQSPQYNDREFLMKAAQRVYSVYGTEIMAGDPQNISDRRARINAWQDVMHEYKSNEVLGKNIKGLWLVLLAVRRQQDEKKIRFPDLFQKQFGDVTHPHTRDLLRTVIIYQVPQIEDPIGQEGAINSEVEIVKKDLVKMSKRRWSTLRSMSPVVPIYALITGNMQLKPLTPSEDITDMDDFPEDE